MGDQVEVGGDCPAVTVEMVSELVSVDILREIETHDVGSDSTSRRKYDDSSCNTIREGHNAKTDLEDAISLSLAEESTMWNVESRNTRCAGVEG